MIFGSLLNILFGVIGLRGGPHVVNKLKIFIFVSILNFFKFLFFQIFFNFKIFFSTFKYFFLILNLFLFCRLFHKFSSLYLQIFSSKNGTKNRKFIHKIYLNFFKNSSYQSWWLLSPKCAFKFFIFVTILFHTISAHWLNSTNVSR